MKRVFLSPWWLALVLIVGIQSSGVLLGHVVFENLLVLAGINILLALSLNFTTGFTGQFSLGHAGFMAMGAYTGAAVSMALRDAGFASSELNFAIAILAGGALSGLLGFVVGLPALRLKGDYLAIVTLGFGEIIRVLLLNFKPMGGAQGLSRIPKWSDFGWVYGLILITVFVSTRLLSSRFGRRLTAIREDEIAAEILGVNASRQKVMIFSLSAVVAGWAGVLYAHYITFISPAIFDFNRSIEILIMVVLGGMGSLTGSIIAALFLTFLREYLRDLQQLTGGLDLRMIIYALCLILLMLWRPKGLFGRDEIGDVWCKVRRRLSFLQR